jgi:hypothetical protein
MFILTISTYLRIPLVLNFFACSEHIHSLSQLKLQNVLDAIMFEPGAWHPPKEKKIPANILIFPFLVQFNCFSFSIFSFLFVTILYFD